jgi:hypothetical protein
VRETEESLTVADDKGANGIIRGAASSIADHMGISLLDAKCRARVNAGVHAHEKCCCTGRRQSQLRLCAEGGHIGRVRSQNLGVQSGRHVEGDRGPERSWESWRAV